MTNIEKGLHVVEVKAIPYAAELKSIRSRKFLSLCSKRDPHGSLDSPITLARDDVLDRCRNNSIRLAVTTFDADSISQNQTNVAERRCSTNPPRIRPRFPESIIDSRCIRVAVA